MVSKKRFQAKLMKQNQIESIKQRLKKVAELPCVSTSSKFLTEILLKKVKPKVKISLPAQERSLKSVETKELLFLNAFNLVKESNITKAEETKGYLVEDFIDLSGTEESSVREEPATSLVNSYSLGKLNHNSALKNRSF